MEDLGRLPAGTKPPQPQGVRRSGTRLRGRTSRDEGAGCRGVQVSVGPCSFPAQEVRLGPVRLRDLPQDGRPWRNEKEKRQEGGFRERAGSCQGGQVLPCPLPARTGGLQEGRPEVLRTGRGKGSAGRQGHALVGQGLLSSRGQLRQIRPDSRGIDQPLQPNGGDR